MSYAEIKDWNQRYHLDGKSVYQLDAEFTSLVKIQMQEIQDKITKLQKTVHTSEREVEKAKGEMFKLQDVLKAIKAENKVSLACLLEFSDLRQDRFDEIMERILSSFGIDYKDENSRIDFELYVRIKCFVKYYTISKEELIKIWMKILNPINNVSLPKDELEDLFEKFARGRIQSQKILVSVRFSQDMITLLVNEGCENPEDKREILLDAIKQKLEDEVIDIELFNQMIKTECSYRVWSVNQEFE